MRLLKTTKPIPAWYLKAGWDNGSYDVEKLIFLPGNSKPIRVPDIRAAGLHRRGERDATIAPPPIQNTQPPHTKGPGLYVPPGYLAREKAKKAQSISSASLAQ